MRIAHISTSDVAGGAARAAYRLHQGLLKIGQDSLIVVKCKDSTDREVLGVGGDNIPTQSDEAFFLETVQEYYINSHRTDLSNTWFSLPYPGYDLTPFYEVRAADIINLHWVAGFQSPSTLQELFALGKPVVWTLHDQWPFSGSCHYTAGCKKYIQDCVACPQLSDDPFDLPAAILKDKLELFKKANLTIASPSRWLASCARESILFKDRRIEVIPYSVDTNAFHPLPKDKAKAGFGLSPETVVLLFGATGIHEKRKGFQVLLAAIQHCQADSKFQQLIADDHLRILCFGHLVDDLEALAVPLVSLGPLGSDEDLRRAYSAANLFVLPSLEDNFPNTMLEAMSCGTPVVGSQTGGISEAVTNEVTGHLVPPGDSHRLGEAILSLIFDAERLQVMEQNCRRAMEKSYSLPIEARGYLALYQDLLKARPHISSAATPANGTDAFGQRPCLVTAVGPHFKAIHEPVLLKALKECSRELNQPKDKLTRQLAAKEEVIQTQNKQLATKEEAIQSQKDQIQNLEAFRRTTLRYWITRGLKPASEKFAPLRFTLNQLRLLKRRLLRR